jgi:hypothetical protein
MQYGPQMGAYYLKKDWKWKNMLEKTEISMIRSLKGKSYAKSKSSTFILGGHDKILKYVWEETLLCIWVNLFCQNNF